MTKSKNLIAWILVFIFLDLSILAINFWIAHQIDHDSLAINLSGRERMLSQRITKTLLALELRKPGQDQEAYIQEFRNSVIMFDQTLVAFEQGGIAVGGDGSQVILKQVTSEPAALFINRAQQIWKPTHERLLPFIRSKMMIPDEILKQVQEEMLQHNLQLLDLMNSLTSALERDSRNQANTLRVVQTTVFILAMLNFVFIVRKLHLMNEKTTQAKELYSELALRDPLTGLFNRRYFENALDREINASHRRPDRSAFAVLMLDLDQFKPINDKFGHEAGDDVLKVIAKRLTQHARTNDIVARLGGDEFMLICSDLCDEQGAKNFCERLLHSINDPIVLNVGKVQVGVSIGIVFYQNKNKSEGDLMRMADNAMYAAKKGGRNNYVIFRDAP